MESYIKILSILILISSLMLVANKRVNSCIKTFRLQSLLISITSGIIGINNALNGESFELIIVCLIIIAVKVIFIPELLKDTIVRIGGPKSGKDFYLNIPLSILICFGLVILSYFTASSIKGIGGDSSRMYLINSMSVIMIGLFFMINRKRAVGQIIGFLVIENGLFTATTLFARGIPMIVDMGILVDLLSAVMIMGVLVFRINENFDSIDINKLRNLRG